MRRPSARACARPPGRARAAGRTCAGPLTFALLAVLVGAATTVAVGPAGPAGAQAPPPSPPGPAHEPVIIVPGWLETPQMMATLRTRFQAAGYPTYVVDLAGPLGIPSTNTEVNGPRVLLAAQFARLLHGAERVTLVGVSYGGVLSRHYMRSLDGLPYVRNYVALGTPERGVALACGLPYGDVGHLCPGSEFVTALNAGDDTPGDVRYASIRSDEDDPAVTALDGVVCRAYVPGVRHLVLQDSEAVFRAAVTHVEGGPCPEVFTGTVPG